METWVWWVIGAVVVLAIIVAAVLAARARKRKQEADRLHAKDLRERASGGERYVASAEDKARQLRDRAQEAEQEADRLRAQADEATRIAREHRDRVTDEYLKADEIDPDANR